MWQAASTTAALVKAVLNDSNVDHDNDRPYMPESSYERYRELISIYARLKNLPDYLHIPRLRAPNPPKNKTWDTDDVDNDSESSDNDDNGAGDETRSMQIALHNLVSSETMTASGLNVSCEPLQFMRDDFVEPADVRADPNLFEPLDESRRLASRRQYRQALQQIEFAWRYLQQQDHETDAAEQSLPVPQDDAVSEHAAVHPKTVLTRRQYTNARIYVLLHEYRVRSLSKEDDLALMAAWKARDLMNGVLVEEYNTANTTHTVSSLIHSAIGTAAYYCGWTDIALKCHFAALEMRMQFVDAVTGESCLPDQVTTLNNVAACLGNRSRPDEAFVFLSVAFDLARKFVPMSHSTMDVLIGNLDKLRNRAKHLNLPGGDAALKSMPNTFLVAMKAWEMPNLSAGKKGKTGGKKGGKKKKK